MTQSCASESTQQLKNTHVVNMNFVKFRAADVIYAYVKIT